MYFYIVEKVKALTNKVDPRLNTERNSKLYDIWSINHVVTGMIFGVFMAPIPAMLIMSAWEPLEVFVISPIMARFGILFGYEALVNAISDIIFDAIGYAIGYFILSSFIGPEVRIFG